MIHAVSTRLPARRTIALLAAALVAVVAAVTLAGGPASTTTSEPRLADAETSGSAQGPTAAGSKSAVEAGAESSAAVTDSDGFAGAVDEAGDRAAPSPVAAPGAGSSQPSIDLKVIRTGVLGLEVKRGTFDEAYAAAQHAATGLGGYVVTASRSGSGRSARFGTLTIRIPGAGFDEAMGELRGIRGAKVERLEVSSQDVTEEYVDTTSRLRHDRAVEARLLALVARAQDVDEVLAVQARLDQVQEQIEVSKGRLTYLARMTEMTTINISIREPGAREEREPAKGQEEREWGVRDSLGEAAHRFVGNVNRFVVWLGGALPALIAVGVLALLVRARLARRSSTRD